MEQFASADLLAVMLFASQCYVNNAKRHASGRKQLSSTIPHNQVIATSDNGDAIAGGMAIGYILPTSLGEYIISNKEISYKNVSAKMGVAKAGAIFVDHINNIKGYYYVI